MEQVAEVIRRLEHLQGQDSGQVSTIGKPKQNLTESDDCRFCESYKTRVQDILSACQHYNSPLGETCELIKRKWKEQLVKAGIYERFWDANFYSIEKRGIPESVKQPYEQVKKYCETLHENIERGAGLVLKGPVGTMKTTLAVAVLQEALWRGYRARKILMQSLLDEIFTLKARNTEEWLQLESDLRNCRLLVVDELGKHQSEGWVMTKFEAIVSERHERRRSTIFVTNLTAQEMKGLYSEGVIDRFNHVNEVITFRGESVRIKGD
jgi:DNA replication protein DnaC